MGNREIKFRALKDDMSNCTFVYGQLIYDAIGNTRITAVDASGEGLTFTTCLKGTEGQFTGLPDKNGKEIYEGDILTLSAIFSLVKSENNNPEVYEVKKQGCDYILKRPDMGLAWGRLSRVEELLWECEVIGNIYENSDLLK